MSDLSIALASLSPDLRASQVGFFWIVSTLDTADFLLADPIPLAQAQLYGDAVTHPGGHYEFWEATIKKGGSYLHSRGLPLDLRLSEYEDWPRGRVVLDMQKKRLNLFADQRLHTQSRIGLIARGFCLPNGSFDLRRDSHYRR